MHAVLGGHVCQRAKGTEYVVDGGGADGGEGPLETVFIAVRLKVRGEIVPARTFVLCAREADGAISIHHVELGEKFGTWLYVEFIAGHEV